MYYKPGYINSEIRLEFLTTESKHKFYILVFILVFKS